MNTLALVVLAQVAVPLVPVQPVEPPPALVDVAPAKGPMHWVITTPVLAGLAGAGAGLLTGERLVPYESGKQGTAMLTGALVGSAVGAGLGFVAGYFAREGSVVGKIASIALWALGGSAAAAAVGVGALFTGLYALSATGGSSFFQIW